MVKERPILFSGDMVWAILEGRKTQTRRIVRARKLHPDYGEPQWNEAFIDGTPPEPYLHVPFAGVAMDRTVHRHYSPWEVGDRLWVREAFQITDYSESTRRLKGTYLAGKKKLPFRKITKAEWDKWENRKSPFCKTSGRFMYKSLARIWLGITNIRVERLQQINAQGLWAEGMEFGCAAVSQGYLQFEKLWDSLNAKRGYPWKKNPWVWVIEFKRIAK